MATKKDVRCQLNFMIGRIVKERKQSFKRIDKLFSKPKGDAPSCALGREVGYHDGLSYALSSMQCTKQILMKYWDWKKVS